jgi:NADH-quinone oxidoreductase subunit J
MSLPFAITALLIVLSAIAAMSLRNLVHCALCLMVTFAGLAALFLQLNAQFVGFAQILVYIGAVAILILFAILLTRSSEMRSATGRTVSSSWALGVVVALATFGSLAMAVLSSTVLRPSIPEPATVTVKEIGTRLMANYVLPLEVIGLLLTAAMVGAALIAMPEPKAHEIADRPSTTP